MSDKLLSIRCEILVKRITKIVMFENDNMVALAIKLAIDNKKSPIEICKSISELANDNSQLISELLGEGITNFILNIFENHLIEFNAKRKNYVTSI
jgi:hypothetical protein